MVPDLNLHIVYQAKIISELRRKLALIHNEYVDLKEDEIEIENPL